MTCSSASGFAGFRFPREVISVAVRWYLRYGLSYRNVEELLAERGVDVDHVTIYQWVQRFTPEFVEAARTCRHVPGDHWFVDETYVKVNRRWTYLYRAIDQHGQVIHVWLSIRRDLTAARAFFHRALATGVVPVEVTTDRAPVYPRVLDELVPAALHTTQQYANNQVEGRPRPAQGQAPTHAGPEQLSDQHGSLPPATPSCRTSDAATTTSPPTHRSITGYRRRSMSWPAPSDSPPGDRSTMPPARPTQQSPQVIRDRQRTWRPAALLRRQPPSQGTSWRCLVSADLLHRCCSTRSCRAHEPRIALQR